MFTLTFVLVDRPDLVDDFVENHILNQSKYRVELAVVIWFGSSCFPPLYLDLALYENDNLYLRFTLSQML